MVAGGAIRLAYQPHGKAVGGGAAPAAQRGARQNSRERALNCSVTRSRLRQAGELFRRAYCSTCALLSVAGPPTLQVGAVSSRPMV
jgi:hypothetical protein